MSLLRRVAAASKGGGREGAPPAVRSPMEGQVATARAQALRSERVRVTRLMMERVGFTEVARIVAMADAGRARLELRPALEAVIQALRSERVRVTRLMMERVGFTEVARIVAMADAGRARLELRPALEAVINADGKLDVTGPERELVITDVLNDVVGLGPLQPLLEDDEITEIMVNGRDRTFVERGGVLVPLGRLFESEEQIRILIDRVISPLGRRVDERSPMVNARLPNGYRVNAVIPPIALDGTASSRRSAGAWTSAAPW